MQNVSSVQVFNLAVRTFVVNFKRCCFDYRGEIGVFVWVEMDTLGKDTECFDVHGSVHHSINHTDITNRMQPCIKIYYLNVY
jgi:hypothetical protein